LLIEALLGGVTLGIQIGCTAGAVLSMGITRLGQRQPALFPLSSCGGELLVWSGEISILAVFSG